MRFKIIKNNKQQKQQKSIKKLSKSKLILVKNFNEKLGLKVFEIRKIGNQYKLVFANKYVLNTTINGKDGTIQIFNSKEKKQENVALFLNIEQVDTNSLDLIVNEIENNLSYKRPLYKIKLLEDAVNKDKNKPVSIYKVKNGKKSQFNVNEESFIENKYNLPITQNKVFVTDLKNKADKMAEILNCISEKNNWKKTFYVSE